MIHKDYCSKCKSTSVPLVKYSKNIYTGIQYYRCRDCVAERGRTYRLTENGARVTGRIAKMASIRNPLKYKARHMVSTAVASKKLIKPTKCEDCNNTKNIQGHHKDYNKPLEVLWLCTSCHAAKHKVY